MRFRTILVIITVAGITDVGVRADITIRGGALNATISTDNGTLMSVYNGPSRCIVDENEDIYDLGGTLATEKSDTVVSVEQKTGQVLLNSENTQLGIRIHKAYRIKGEELIKEVNYSGDFDKSCSG